MKLLTLIGLAFVDHFDIHQFGRTTFCGLIESPGTEPIQYTVHINIFRSNVATA